MKKSIWIWTALLGVIIGLLLWPLFVPTNRGGSSSSYAANTVYSLKNAISSYFTDYRKLPGFDSPQDYDLDLQSDQKFMDYLLGSNEAHNERGGVYFTQRKAKLKSDGTYSKGLSVNADGSGSLWDPWGNHYRIRIDANGDDKVANPQNNELTPESVLIWSAGKDGKFETWKDNLKTW